MSKAGAILAGLGGSNNIDNIEACITRLRVDVKDPGAVDQKQLSSAGAFGVVQVGSTVQVVVGPSADDLCAQINKLV